MPEKIQRQHTVLPKSHLRDYFGGRPFQTYDLKNRKWESWGPNSLGRIKEYHEHEIEDELQKIDSNAIPALRKLARRHTLSDKDRQHVAWYIAASLFRNPSLFNELLPDISEGSGISMDQLTSDERLQRKAHGAWLDNAPEFPLIAENIYDLSWHIFYVARKPNYLLLTDRPFLVRFPAHPTKAEFTFPISSEVMLYINHDHGKRWHREPMERKDVIAHGRNLIVMASQFVAVPKQDAPKQDEKLAKMIGRVKAAKTPPTA